MEQPDFTLIHREHGDRWLHKSGVMWIVFYPCTPGRAAHFQAYATKGKVPPGRDPWSVDNRRLGNADHGFPTFEAAAAAVAEAVPA